jgi:hypothetical protein
MNKARHCDIPFFGTIARLGQRQDRKWVGVVAYAERYILEVYLKFKEDFSRGGATAQRNSLYFVASLRRCVRNFFSP